jgi:hypothetical protein
MGHKIVFGSGVAQGGADDFAGRHFKISNQGLRAMPLVLILVQLQLAFGHGMIRVNPFQCLNAGFFVHADHMRTRFMQFLRLMIEFAHLSDLLPKRRIILGFVIEPIFDSMGFQIPLILKNAQYYWARWCLQCPAQWRFEQVPVVSTG